MAIATKLGSIGGKYDTGDVFEVNSEVKSKNQRCKVLYFENVIFFF